MRNDCERSDAPRPRLELAPPNPPDTARSVRSPELPPLMPFPVIDPSFGTEAVGQTDERRNDGAVLELIHAEITETFSKLQADVELKLIEQAQMVTQQRLSVLKLVRDCSDTTDRKLQSLNPAVMHPSWNPQKMSPKSASPMEEATPFSVAFYANSAPIGRTISQDEATPLSGAFDANPAPIVRTISGGSKRTSATSGFGAHSTSPTSASQTSSRKGLQMATEKSKCTMTGSKADTKFSKVAKMGTMMTLMCDGPTDATIEAKVLRACTFWRMGKQDLTKKSCMRPVSRQTSIIAKFAHSIYFGILVALLIGTNSICIGIQINYETCSMMNLIQGREGSDVWGFRIGKLGNIIFCSLFTVELCIRIYVERLVFFIGNQCKWNMFDLLLVISAIVELVFEGIMGNMSFARSLRILRMIKVLQILRLLRVFDVLRQMVFAILNSFVSMVWIVVLLLLWMYVFGIYFLSVVSQHAEDVARDEAPRGPHLDDLDRFFGTLLRSMLSLFQSVSGGRNWYEVMAPLSAIHDANVLIFVAFYVFIVLGVMNIVTGIFVEKATEIAELDREMRVLQRLNDNDSFSRELRAFFKDIDSDGNGTLEWAEFSEHLSDRRVQAYFESLGLEASNARQVFELLDKQGHGKVSVDAFLDGCVKLKGTAKSIDMHVVELETKKVSKMIHVLMGYLEDQLAPLRRSVVPDDGECASIGERLQQIARDNSGRSFHRKSHIIEWPSTVGTRSLSTPTGSHSL